MVTYATGRPHEPKENGDYRSTSTPGEVNSRSAGASKQVNVQRQNRRGRTARGQRAAFVVTLISFIAVAVAPPVSAVGAATSVPPYSSSTEYQFCNPTASCDTTVSADHQTGSLVIDLRVIGTKMPAPSCYFFCTIQFYDAGGWGRATVFSVRALSKPVSSITFTVVVETGRSLAEATPNAHAAVTLGAYATNPNCVDSCHGSTSMVLASSSSQPSALPATTSLRFTYRHPYGKIPAGDVTTGVTLWAGGAGLGNSQASSSAAVKSISSSIEP